MPVAASMRAPRALVVTLVLGLAGCGPLRPRPPEPAPEIIEAAEAARALETRIRREGLLPASSQIAEDAVLYTEMTRPPEIRGLEVQRDTIRGGAELSRRLQHRQMQSRGAAFELRTRRVFRCRDAVIQAGVYPMAAAESERIAAAPRAEPEETVVWVPFTARWREADGTLELQALWLGPLDYEVRVSRLADDCRDTGAAIFARAYAGRRMGLELGVGYPLHLEAIGYLQDAVTEHGWDRNVTGHAPISGALAGFYRLRPGVQIETLVSYHRPARVEATGDVFDATLEWTGGSAAVLLVGELGPFRVGAGPAVAYESWSWSDRVFNDVYPSGEPTSGTSLVPGGVTELGYIQTLRSRVYIHLRARYGWLADGEVPGFRDLAPLDAPLSRARLAVGLGYWW